MILGKKHRAEQAVDQYTHAMLKLAFGVLNNREDAKDVCQEAFLRFYETMDSVENTSAWLYRVTINLAINLKKRSLHNSKWDEIKQSNPEHTDPLIELERREKLERLQDAIARLPEGQRSVFLLRQQLELPIKAIAEKLNITEGTVKKQLSRAVGSLSSQIRNTYLQEVE